MKDALAKILANSNLLGQAGLAGDIDGCNALRLS